MIEITQMEPMAIELRVSTLEETETEPFADSNIAFCSPEVFESQWFRQILTLIFIMAMIQIVDFLWAVRVGITILVHFTVLNFCELLFQLAVHTLVLVTFAVICLYFHFHSLPLLPILSRRYQRVNGKRKLVIQNCFWVLLIGSITACLIVFSYVLIIYTFIWEGPFY